MKKQNLIAIIIILLIAGLGFIAFWGLNAGSEKALLRITQKGKTITTLPLNQNYQETIINDLGENTVVIEDGKANVSHADCENQVCVNSPSIDVPGESIACLPHKLILEIIQEVD